MPEIPDNTILEIAISDKAKAFEIAFNQYWLATYEHACRKIQSPDIAKDLVQEVFLTLWDSLDKLVGQEKLVPYIYGILRNKILKLYERDSVRLRYALSLARAQPLSVSSVEEQLHGKELQAVIMEEVERMPPRMKTVYLLKKEENCSISEIATNLGISEQTVKNQLQQAYNRLKDRLKDYDSNAFFAGLAFCSYCL